MEQTEVYKNALSLLTGDETGEIEDLFEEIIIKEKSLPKDAPIHGWEWFECHADPRTLNKLVTHRLLNIVMKSNKSCYYTAADVPAIERALTDFRSLTKVEHAPAEIPNDILDVVVGHNEKKEIIMRSLHTEKPVHILMFGSVASAKSLMLEELARLPYSKFVLGSSLTKAGIYDVLFNEKPRYLIVDEIDKIDDSENLTCLLSLMERGHIVETKYRRQREMKLKTWVFAACNRLDRLPIELRSRFLLLRFKDYTPDEFLEVVERVLTTREGMESGLALRVGNEVLRRLDSRDVRDAVKISRLLKERSVEDINKVVDILRAQK